MAYRPDRDLCFLAHMYSSDLEPLVDILVYDNDGNKRYTEELTMRPEYHKYGSDYARYWKTIAGELQCYGANTMATLMRGGEGVFYKEILCDVCDQLGIKYEKKWRADFIENRLLIFVFRKMLDGADNETKMQIARNLGCEISHTGRVATHVIIKVLQDHLRSKGFQLYMDLVTLLKELMLKYLDRVPTWVENKTATWLLHKLIKAPGPYVNAFLFINLIASQAYRVTIPACILIALMRKQYDYEIETGIRQKRVYGHNRKTNWTNGFTENSSHSFSDSHLVPQETVSPWVVGGTVLGLGAIIGGIVYALNKK